MKFERYAFHPALKRSIEDLGFKRPTDIQYKAIASILKQEDVLAIAQTGTGKTAAFAIPVIQMLLANKSRHDSVRALVLVPTRELAVQIHKVFEALTKHCWLKTFVLVGGVDQESHLKKLGQEPDILIATPGRMFDFIYQKHIKITKTEILVLDEADKMLALGFYKDIQDVKKFLPARHQTLYFSATINEEIKDLAYSLVRNPIRIQISPQNTVSKNVDHTVAMIEQDDKRFFLERMIKQSPESRMVVFVRTKVRAERVYEAMKRAGLVTTTVHGDKDQQERFAAINDFTSGAVKVLITTDVTSRGIDIPGVEYVVNYDLPELPENYIHRLGRTGRGIAKGFAVSFCSEGEKPLLKEIEAYLGGAITPVKIDKDEYKETIDFTDDPTAGNLNDLLKELDQLEAKKRKSAKGKKKS